jgi:hypothetical protein
LVIILWILGFIIPSNTGLLKNAHVLFEYNSIFPYGVSTVSITLCASVKKEKKVIKSINKAIVVFKIFFF